MTYPRSHRSQSLSQTRTQQTRRVLLSCAIALVWAGCGTPQPHLVSYPSTDNPEPWMQVIAAGWLGCEHTRVAISDVQSTPGATNTPAAWTWQATCEDAEMVCSSANGVRCSPRRATAAQVATDSMPPMLTRDLPPAVIACTERPVRVEGLFDSDGRLSELRPWPGETPEQRDCVAQALNAIEIPGGSGALVRFEPRDPWNGETESP